MTLKLLLPGLAAALLSASAAYATTIATWTFEISQPTNSATANTYYTNITAETGNGTASALHAAATIYSSPVGNGSSHCFSSASWAVGDFYQFETSTLGAQNINVSYDQTASNTGPGRSYLAYSLDGINFTVALARTNTILANASPNPTWSGTTRSTVYATNYDLSSITAINNQPVVYFRVVDASTISANGGTVAAAGTCRIDNFSVVGATGTPPSISGVNPPNLTTNAGNNVTFTVTISQGDAPLFYQWYTAATDNTLTLINNATNTSLTLTNVLAADATNYVIVVTNSTGSATSSVAPLTVIDPAINTQPASQQALPNGAAQFTATAAGTGISYQWYFCADPSDNTQLTGQVTDGTLTSGAIASGSATSTLTVSNVTVNAQTNFALVVTGTFGSVTSSVVSLTVGTSQVPLAFWNFNGSFDTNSPTPYQGIGTASGVSVVTFAQGGANADANDLTPGPNGSWGSETYPAATSSNKQAGVQFKVSTLGAKNIKLSFELRGTTTASKYQRLQYTTNGTDFVDYPASQSIAAVQAGTYNSYAYDLTGFPGVANNPNFGIRLVSEFENTGKYNNTNDATYVGVSAGYAATGTLSYDLVEITGDAIVGNNNPPTVSAIGNQTIEDTFGTNVSFTVSDDSTPAGSLGVNATSLDPATSVSLSPANTAGNVQLSINSSLGNIKTINVPILVSVTDGNGDSTVQSFLLTIGPANSPPVFTGLVTTSILTNTSIVIPFIVSDDHTPVSSITPTVTSGNSLLVPNDSSHLSLSGSGANYTLTITPAADQSGAVPITVSGIDGGGLTGSQTFTVEVLPNTNIVLIDNFDYDTSTPTSILTASGGFWQNHSGTIGQLKVNGTVAIIDSVNNSEDVNAPLINGPYLTNMEDNVTLYSSYTVHFTTLPNSPSGAYITHFKDNTVFGFLGRVWAATNNAAPGTYRLGIGNSSQATATTAQLAQDLSPNVDYTVVVRIRMTNGFCSLWINPTSESSPSVTDITEVTNLVNIYSYAFRESTGSGIVNVDNLKVGTSFTGVTGLPSTNPNPPSPSISSISLGSVGGTNAVFLSGTNNNGNVAGSYVVLGSTNIALPLSNWTVISTQSFNLDGTFNFTNGVGQDNGQFFIIQALP
ncbi:MAG TPA: immunoglobulin domain-containing protein [Verrucomicrobiae bacterium]|jgi:hypothetical protein|nr:immunoglobulin domain-containing protein [Verrucomicrobiae bacterium]